MSIGDNIRNARINKKINQIKLAEMLTLRGVKIGNTTISNWENGISKPDPDTIAILCDILEVDANYILGFENNSNRNAKDIKALLEAYEKLPNNDKEFIKNIVIERKRQNDKESNKDIKK